MNPLDAGFICLQKIVTYSGRATRSEFWWFVCIVCAYDYIASILLQDYAFSSPVSIVNLIISGSLSFALSSVMIRRLHDIGKSGWSQLIILTIIGIILFIYWLTFPSEPADNQYGKYPRKDDLKDDLSEVASETIIYQEIEDYSSDEALRRAKQNLIAQGVALEKQSIVKNQQPQSFGKRNQNIPKYQKRL